MMEMLNTLLIWLATGVINILLFIMLLKMIYEYNNQENNNLSTTEKVKTTTLNKLSISSILIIGGPILFVAILGILFLGLKL